MTMNAVPVSVGTTGGLVRGQRVDGVTVFRGIPFAAPPVGHLRFQPPQHAARWEGTWEADVFGPPPPQMPMGARSEAPAATVRHGADDWLTVNVWSPDVGAAGLPVMVWIYGGAYRFGSSAAPADTDGGVLARSGVVVVSGNHRVGMEGYASWQGAPENRGLLDQIALLRWVHDNIVAFGGDPAAVTVFGESAGAGAVANLLAAPTARGLFARAIVQSLPGTYLTPKLARDIAKELVSPLRLSPAAAALKDVPFTALADAGSLVDTRMGPVFGRTGELAKRWGSLAGTLTPFSPVVDGDTLPTDPWSALRAGAAKDVKLLVGHNRDEWRLFLYFSGLAGRIGDSDAEWALNTFGPRPGGADAVRRAYPEATAEELFAVVQSDWLFRMPSLHLATAQIEGGGAAHMYELTYPAPASSALGACHALDVALVFGTTDRSPELFGEQPPQDAIDVSARMQAAWVAFATSGDPGWAAFDDRDGWTRLFDSAGPPECLPYPETSARALWSSHRFRPLELQE